MTPKTHLILTWLFCVPAGAMNAYAATWASNGCWWFNLLVAIFALFTVAFWSGAYWHHRMGKG